MMAIGSLRRRSEASQAVMCVDLSLLRLIDNPAYSDGLNEVVIRDVIWGGRGHFPPNFAGEKKLQKKRKSLRNI